MPSSDAFDYGNIESDLLKVAEALSPKKAALPKPWMISHDPDGRWYWELQYPVKPGDTTPSGFAETPEEAESAAKEAFRLSGWGHKNVLGSPDSGLAEPSDAPICNRCGRPKSVCKFGNPRECEEIAMSQKPQPKSAGSAKKADAAYTTGEMQIFLSNYDPETSLNIVSAANESIQLPVWEVWDVGGKPTISVNTDPFYERIKKLGNTENRETVPHSWPITVYKINDARAHLRAALVQAIPEDDQIIVEHIREAEKILATMTGGTPYQPPTKRG